MSAPWEDFAAQKAPVSDGPWNDFKPAKVQDNKEDAPVDSKPTSFIDTAKDIGSSILHSVSPELSTAVDAFNSPAMDKVKQLTAVPEQGLQGIAAGVVNSPKGLDVAMQRANDAIQPGYQPQSIPEKVGSVAADLSDPRAMVGNKLIEAALPILGVPAKALGKQAAKLSSLLNGVDRRSIEALASDPIKILKSPSSAITGKAFQAAKEAAGVTGAEERAIALSDGVKKKVYSNVMKTIDAGKAPQESIDKAAEEFGKKYGGVSTHMPSMISDVAKAYAENPKNAESYLDHIIPRMVRAGEGPTKGTFLNEFGEVGSGKALPFPDKEIASKFKDELLSKLQEHPVLNGGPQVSVADLLKAKKAGQLLAEKDPQAAGLIQKEIHEKLNPLLQKMAPDVYEAQQAVHISKVKEAFMNIFPQGKGLYPYFRTIGMMASGLKHPALAAMESPIATGAAIVAGKGALSAATSPVGRQVMAQAGLNTLRNNSALQSIKDKLKNAESNN